MASIACRLALVAALALALACGNGARGVARRSAASAEFAAVKAARSELLAARDALERSQAEARSVGADTDALRLARSAYDAAHTREQRVLAAFLTVALNERPSDPETREALGFYADGAVANARVILERGGDARRALETLESAERPFRALGLSVPNDLAATIQQARRLQANPPTTTPTPRPSTPGRRARGAHASHR
jgi:hypothetical protein